MQRSGQGDGWGWRWGGVSAALLAVVITGCTTCGPRPPTAEVRASMGTVGLALAGPTTEFTYRVPPGRCGGMGRGAAVGAVSVMAGALQAGGHPVAVLIVIGVGLAVAVPVGATVGFIQGLPAAERERLAAEVKRCDVTLPFEELLRRDVLAAAGEQAGRTLVLLQGAALEPGPRVVGRDTGAAAGTDTYLELTVTHFSIADAACVNVRQHLVAHVRCRLVRVTDGTALYTYRAVYQSDSRRLLSDWVAQDGALLRAELPTASTHLANDLVAQLFVRPASAKPSPLATTP